MTHSEQTVKSTPLDENPSDAARKLLAARVPFPQWLASAGAEPEELWDGLLYRGALHVLTGPASVGKSTLIERLLQHLIADSTQSPGGTFLKRRCKSGQHALLMLTETEGAIYDKLDEHLGGTASVTTLSASYSTTSFNLLCDRVKGNSFDVAVYDAFGAGTFTHPRSFPCTTDQERVKSATTGRLELMNCINALEAAAHESKTAVILVCCPHKNGPSSDAETFLQGTADVCWHLTKTASGRNMLQVVSRFEAPLTIEW
jgi:hypothetical protein